MPYWAQMSGMKLRATVPYVMRVDLESAFTCWLRYVAASLYPASSASFRFTM